MSKNSCGVGGLIAYSLSSREIRKGVQGRNQEAGGDAEAREEGHLLDFSQWLAQSAFL